MYLYGVQTFLLLFSGVLSLKFLYKNATYFSSSQTSIAIAKSRNSEFVNTGVFLSFLFSINAKVSTRTHKSIKLFRMENGVNISYKMHDNSGITKSQ